MNEWEMCLHSPESGSALQWIHYVIIVQYVSILDGPRQFQ